MQLTILTSANLFCAGLLAGAETAVRYGIRDPIRVLPDGPQILFRQAIARTLRVLIPVIFAPTVLSTVAVLVSSHDDVSLTFRGIAMAVLLAWLCVTFLGTVPINEAVLTWRPDAPPVEWRDFVGRWERLDTIRTWLTLLAFSCLLAAVDH